MENFQDFSADAPSDWAQALPREVFREVIRVLRGSMPLPETDAAEEWGRQDRAAMAAVAALRPENAAEGQLAAQFVLAEAWAADCLRLAGERRRETGIALKCKAQALSFMREAKSAWRLLLKAQAERRALEKDAEALGRAEWAEHAALGMMAEGLAAEEAGSCEKDGAVGEVVPVGPHPGPLPEGVGEGDEAVGVAGMAGFGFGSDFGTASRGVRRETGLGLGALSSGVPAFA